MADSAAANALDRALEVRRFQRDSYRFESVETDQLGFPSLGVYLAKIEVDVWSSKVSLLFLSS